MIFQRFSATFKIVVPLRHRGFVLHGETYPNNTKTLVLYWVYVDYPMVLYRPDVLK